MIRAISIGFSITLNAILAGNAFAQSAEETVAYIVDGLEDGATVAMEIDGKQRTALVSRKPTEETVFSLKWDNGTISSTKIRKVNDCLYILSGIDIDGNPYDGTTVDLGGGNLLWSHIEKSRSKANYPHYTICFNADDPQKKWCNANPTISDRRKQDENRIIRAVEYFTSEYCKQKAF